MILTSDIDIQSLVLENVPRVSPLNLCIGVYEILVVALCFGLVTQTYEGGS